MRNSEEAERASKGGAAAEGGRRAIASGIGTGGGRLRRVSSRNLFSWIRGRRYVFGFLKKI